MNTIIRENAQNRKLFRELFLSSQKNLKTRFGSLKKNFSCAQCSSCCKDRYLEVSPVELKELAKQESLWAEFADFFVAIERDDVWTQKVRDFVGQEVWFYSCRYFDGEKCTYSGQKKSFCRECGISFEKVLPLGCSYNSWQKAILQDIQEEVFKDILLKYQQMNAYRDNFACACCATCCKFACSEFSYEELKEKASRGDTFATQFVSVFVPYEDQEKAREVYPEYVDMLEKKLGKEEKVWFYYCPHLGEDNLCTQYDKRPGVCRDFPNNALSILPPICGFYAWKEEVEVLAMTLHALVNLGEFYKERLEQILK